MSTSLFSEGFENCLKFAALNVLGAVCSVRHIQNILGTIDRDLTAMGNFRSLPGPRYLFLGGEGGIRGSGRDYGAVCGGAYNESEG